MFTIAYGQGKRRGFSEDGFYLLREWEWHGTARHDQGMKLGLGVEGARHHRQQRQAAYSLSCRTDCQRSSLTLTLHQFFAFVLELT